MPRRVLTDAPVIPELRKPPPRIRVAVNADRGADTVAAQALRWALRHTHTVHVPIPCRSAQTPDNRREAFPSSSGFVLDPACVTPSALDATAGPSEREGDDRH